MMFPSSSSSEAFSSSTTVAPPAEPADVITSKEIGEHERRYHYGASTNTVPLQARHGPLEEGNGSPEPAVNFHGILRTTNYRTKVASSSIRHRKRHRRSTVPCNATAGSAFGVEETELVVNVRFGAVHIREHSLTTMLPSRTTTSADNASNRNIFCHRDDDGDLRLPVTLDWSHAPFPKSISVDDYESIRERRHGRVQRGQLIPIPYSRRKYLLEHVGTMTRHDLQDAIDAWSEWRTGRSDYLKKENTTAVVSGCSDASSHQQSKTVTRSSLQRITKRHSCATATATATNPTQ